MGQLPSVDNSGIHPNTYMVVNWTSTAKKNNGMIYASLYDSSYDGLIISADVKYILRAAQERGYTIDNIQAVMTDIANHGHFDKR